MGAERGQSNPTPQQRSQPMHSTHGEHPSSQGPHSGQAPAAVSNPQGLNEIKKQKLKRQDSETAELDEFVDAKQ